MITNNDKILKLDYYVIPPLRLYIMIFGIMIVFSSLSFNYNSYMSFVSLLIRLLYFSFGILMLSLSLIRKSLYVRNGNLSNTLTLFDKVLFKKEIHKNLYFFGSVERLDKVSNLLGIGYFKPLLLLEYDGFAIYLQDQEKTKRVRLIGLADAHKLNQAIEFIQNNSDIQFGKTHYDNHW